MNINDLVSAGSAKTYLGQNSATQSVASTSGLVRTDLQKAEMRVQSQVDSTSIQLSSFGKLKSSVSSLQLAAHQMASLPVSSTSASLKTAADSFVSAFNSSMTEAQSSAKTGAAQGGAAASQSAAKVGKDLTRALSGNTGNTGNTFASTSANPSTLDAMKKIGFSVQSDGTLALDAKKFDAALKSDPTAVQATLSKVGQQVDATATQELSASGNVTHSVSSLSQRASVLKNQQNTLASLQQVSSASAQSASSFNSSFNFASSSLFG